MKQILLWLIVVALFASGVALFHRSGGFLADRDYLAGLIHVFAGLATLRAGVEIARLAVILRLRAQ